MKTKILFVLAVVVLLLCSVRSVERIADNGAVDDGGELKNAKGRVAIVISTLNNPWFVVLGETAAQRCKELGYETVLFDSQNNPSKEAEHFDNIIASGYDAILFNATDAEGSIVNVKAAIEADIPVFCIDREINAENLATCQVLSDNYNGCVEIAKVFVKEVGEKGKYAELLGIVGDNNTWNRSKGFHSVVDKHLGLEMVAQQTAQFDRNMAMEVLESILQAHPDIIAVFCGNDAMAMGAYQAVVSAGKTEQIKVFGFDGEKDVMNSIKEGKIIATGLQSPKLEATTAAEYAVGYLEGKRDIPRKEFIDVKLITKENVNEYIDR